MIERKAENDTVRRICAMMNGVSDSLGYTLDIFTDDEQREVVYTVIVKQELTKSVSRRINRELSTIEKLMTETYPELAYNIKLRSIANCG